MKRAFTQKSELVNEQSLKKVLGSCVNYYNELMKITQGFKTKWTFYKGWSLKVFDNKKALFYLAPHYDGYLVSMAIRENEYNSLLGSENVKFIHEQLLSSEKVSEGYPLRIEVSNLMLAKACNAVVSEIIKLR